MRLIRTAAGDFLNVEKIACLVDERAAAADRWVAICADGDEIALAAYYSAPGRLERELPHLMMATPAMKRTGAEQAGAVIDCPSGPHECCGDPGVTPS